MKREILGLDISDDYIAAVVVQGSGQDRRITACGHAELADRRMLGDVLSVLLDKLAWKGGRCACGISLDGVSLRNLTVPFLERKKIDQVLPLELEDQLLTPVGYQIIEYIATGTVESSTGILVAAVEKARLGQDLENLRLHGIIPRSVTLRNVALAEHLLKNGKLPSSFLLLDAGVHSVNMVLTRNGRVSFIRRLPYPERMFIQAPFSFRNGLATFVDYGEAKQSIVSLGEDIERTIAFSRANGAVDSFPDLVVMSGSMAQERRFRELLQEAIGHEVIASDLRDGAGVQLDGAVAEQWEPALLDHALALALRGIQKKQAMNFRKDEFAPERLLFATRRQMAAAASLAVVLIAATLAWLGFDYHDLRTSYDAAGERMNQLYRETFPEATRIVDPLAQMQANVRDVQAPAIATPVFSGEKRTLNLLADISGRIPEAIEIHVSRLVIDQDTVQLRGTTDTFNNVNIIQGNLRKSPLFSDVNIVSAAADKDSGKIRFELKLQIGGIS
ncbi:MAG: type II secretion system protein GspL [Desulfobulbaceae bacterium]|nr:type II secretion system protein GspL [Desulfobulbaceae bacterium]